MADREHVESNADDILEIARDEDVAFLVVGDPFCATTHTDLMVRARKEGITVKPIHNASIMDAMGAAGLQLYRFGQAVSIVFFTETWRPDSFYDKIKLNRSMGLHTLCLLDIKMKEVSDANLARGRMIYEPPRFMSVNTCIEQLLEVEEKRGEGAFAATSACVGLARMGRDDQFIAFGTMAELAEVDFGKPLHSVLLPADDIHDMEREMLDLYKVDGSKVWELNGAAE